MKKLCFVLIAMIMMLTACAPAATPTPMQVEGQPTNPPVVQPTAGSVKTEEPAVVATEAPPAVPPTEAAQPKELIMGIGQEGWPMRGFTIETDDMFFLNGDSICDTLVWVDWDGNLAPALATSWTMTDTSTWEFKLRSGVKFQDGGTLTAADIVRSLQYVANSATAPRGFSKETFASIEAVGEDTVVIKTTAPDVLLPNRLTAPATCVFSANAYPSTSGPINPFGTATGAFILTDMVPEQSMTAVKNPNYWGGEVKIDKVTFLFVPDAAVRAGMLQTGEINISSNIPIEQVPILELDENVTIVKHAETRTTTMHLNMSREPFSDLRVRQAVNYAIDRQLIVDAVLEGNGSPALGPISPPEGWFNPELQGFPYDPEKAKTLLAEAGYADGLTVSLWTYASRAILPPIALAIQDMLADVGINVELRVAQYDAMEPDVLSGNFDMFLMSRNHVLDSYDPEAFFTSDYSCLGSFNMDLFCNEQFDNILAEARTTSDSAARFDLYRQLQQIIEDQAVGSYIHYNMRIDAHTNNVINFRVHPLNRFNLNAQLDIAPAP